MSTKYAQELLTLTVDEARTILNNRMKMAKKAGGQLKTYEYEKKPAHEAPLYWRQAVEACEILALAIKREHLGPK